MPQDAYTLSKLQGELASLLIGGKISRINQPAKDELSLLIYTHCGTVKLNIGLSARFCRISVGEKRAEENPKNAPNFCMLLRKHLQNAEITSIGQAGFERVIYFDFLCFSEFSACEMRLYLEIMGKYSNAVLTKDGVIVGALKTTSLESAKRITLAGAIYTLPEKQDKADPTDLYKLRELFTGAFGESGLACGDAADFISAHVAGISYVTAGEICSLCGGTPSYKDVYDYIKSDALSPCVTFRGGEPVDFAARSNSFDKRPYPTLLDAQAAYYDAVIAKREFEEAKRKLCSALSSAIKKKQKGLAQIDEKLAECEKTDEVKLAGELITANIYAVKRGQKELKAINYYDENGGEITIKLDERLTPAQNAQKYYARYAKLKRTYENLTVRRQKSEEEVSYLLSIMQSLDCAESEDDLHGIREELLSLSLIAPQADAKRKKADLPKPFRTFRFGGFTVICGRNNLQNDRLIKSLAANDLWLHVKAYHSSHVGILAGGKEVAEGVIKFAAEICAYYSEARGKDKVQVDFTERKYVKRVGAGRALYTDFKTITIAPERHAEAREDE